MAQGVRRGGALTDAPKAHTQRYDKCMENCMRRGAHVGTGPPRVYRSNGFTPAPKTMVGKDPEIKTSGATLTALHMSGGLFTLHVYLALETAYPEGHSSRPRTVADRLVSIPSGQFSYVRPQDSESEWRKIIIFGGRKESRREQVIMDRQSMRESCKSVRKRTGGM